MSGSQPSHMDHNRRTRPNSAGGWRAYPDRLRRRPTTTATRVTPRTAHGTPRTARLRPQATASRPLCGRGGLGRRGPPAPMGRPRSGPVALVRCLVWSAVIAPVRHRTGSELGPGRGRLLRPRHRAEESPGHWPPGMAPRPVPCGFVYHSDRGCQHLWEFVALCAAHGVRRSVGTVGAATTMRSPAVLHHSGMRASRSHPFRHPHGDPYRPVRHRRGVLQPVASPFGQWIPQSSRALTSPHDHENRYRRHTEIRQSPKPGGGNRAGWLRPGWWLPTWWSGATGRSAGSLSAHRPRACERRWTASFSATERWGPGRWGSSSDVESWKIICIREWIRPGRRVGSTPSNGCPSPRGEIGHVGRKSGK
ncbi:hypothetical protein FsymDg_2586 [Candidatus Protofrankia datiscae]|uniref:Uncharacterized protein n=1 Tax=Candidatus Protofrankia datiscae TaxID=2716812 RepID=F8B338_9ACTN|nr:hypothetical protein FsymDg_2586 [Candidatus Protofrankia datiscae]